MISKIELVPTTKDSYCFATTVDICGFEEHDYIEEEYYMHGTSNLYESDTNGEPKIYCSDAPYTNRFVVRAPKDKTNFSGNVVIKIINPSSEMEIDRMWILGTRNSYEMEIFM